MFRSPYTYIFIIVSNIFSTFSLENKSSVLIGVEQSTEIPQSLALTIPYNYFTQSH